jgi:hypothetical protein
MWGRSGGGRRKTLDPCLGSLSLRGSLPRKIARASDSHLEVHVLRHGF